eukprot:298339_1
MCGGNRDQEDHEDVDFIDLEEIEAQTGNKPDPPVFDRVRSWLMPGGKLAPANVVWIVGSVLVFALVLFAAYRLLHHQSETQNLEKVRLAKIKQEQEKTDLAELQRKPMEVEDARAVKQKEKDDQAEAERQKLQKKGLAAFRRHLQEPLVKLEEKKHASEKGTAAFQRYLQEEERRAELEKKRQEDLKNNQKRLDFEAYTKKERIAKALEDVARVPDFKIEWDATGSELLLQLTVATIAAGGGQLATVRFMDSKGYMHYLGRFVGEQASSGLMRIPGKDVKGGDNVFVHLGGSDRSKEIPPAERVAVEAEEQMGERKAAEEADLLRAEQDRLKTLEEEPQEDPKNKQKRHAFIAYTKKERIAKALEDERQERLAEQQRLKEEQDEARRRKAHFAKLKEVIGVPDFNIEWDATKNELVVRLTKETIAALNINPAHLEVQREDENDDWGLWYIFNTEEASSGEKRIPVTKYNVKDFRNGSALRVVVVDSDGSEQIESLLEDFDGSEQIESPAKNIPQAAIFYAKNR